jgi:hypothetical protein
MTTTRQTLLKQGWVAITNVSILITVVGTVASMVIGIFYPSSIPLKIFMCITLLSGVVFLFSCARIADIRRDELKAIDDVMGYTEGGIYKRIDENRELLELFIRDAPGFLESRPWVRSFIQHNDEFLQALSKCVPPSHPFIGASPTFPRPWPEDAPPFVLGERYSVERNGITDNFLASLDEVEAFLKTCAMVPGSEDWLAAMAGVPVNVDGSQIRFVPQPK